MSDNGEASPPKRKHPDDDSNRERRTRAKRNRYIAIACNECKRRKIKCNGQTPCDRCGSLSLECIYAPNCCNNFKDSEEYKDLTQRLYSHEDQLRKLERLVEALSSASSRPSSHPAPSIESPMTYTPPKPGVPDTWEVSRRIPAHTPSESQTPKLPPSPSFERLPRIHGPTSNMYNISVAQSSLHTMGITTRENSIEDSAVTLNDSPPRRPHSTTTGAHILPMLHADKDPIWALTQHEAVRLINHYHEEMGMMYPFIDIEEVKRRAVFFFKFVEGATKSGLMQGQKQGSDSIMTDDIIVIKLIMAISLITEGGGRSPLGEKLFNNVRSRVESNLNNSLTLQNIHMLILTAMYHFHRDDEARAWMVLGQAARQCLALGLHQPATYNILFPKPHERASAVRTFWVVYVLDRRWSFGTSLPFALPENHIDPNLPKPPDNSFGYLTAMIAYSNIGSKVWGSVANVNSRQQNIDKDSINYYDYKILHWYQAVPPALQYRRTERTITPPNRGFHRLQVALYLRLNQMRILIYRPVLYTATSIMENLDFARTVVNVAKDTIQVLTQINQETDLYRSQQMMFNYFLISALAVLFLAVAHTPAEFSADCRDEFYASLQLVRGLSASSFVSKRLWKSISMLKEVGPKLGLSTDLADAHSSAAAAVAMAGLAGHQVDERAMFQGSNSGELDDPNPHGMATDLTHLFEAAGGSHEAPSHGFGMAERAPEGDEPLGMTWPRWEPDGLQLYSAVSPLF